MSTKIKMRKHNLCHRCPHNGKGDPACLTCPDPVLSAHHGAVSLQALVEIGKEPVVEPSDVYYDDGDDGDDYNDGDNTMQRNRIDDLMRVITTFFGLTAQQFEVVKTLYQDKKTDGYATYRNAAAKLGVDRHVIADTLAAALTACPALAALRLQFKHPKRRDLGSPEELVVVDTASDAEAADDDMNYMRLPPGEPTDADTPEYHPFIVRDAKAGKGAK